MKLKNIIRNTKVSRKFTVGVSPRAYTAKGSHRAATGGCPYMKPPLNFVILPKIWLQSALDAGINKNYFYMLRALKPDSEYQTNFF